MILDHLHFCKISYNSRYIKCSEKIACQDFKDEFKLEETKYISLNYHYELYCKRKIYKSVLISVSTFISPIFQILFLFLADRYGRRKIILFLSIIGFIGTAIAVFANSLLQLGFGFTFISIYYTSTFSLNYIFINELLIDPLRSKASGIKTFLSAIGTLGFYIYEFIICQFLQFCFPRLPLIRMFLGLNLFLFS